MNISELPSTFDEAVEAFHRSVLFRNSMLVINRDAWERFKVKEIVIKAHRHGVAEKVIEKYLSRRRKLFNVKQTKYRDKLASQVDTQVDKYRTNLQKAFGH